MLKKIVFLVLVVILISLLGSINVIADDNFLEKIKGAGIKSDGKPITVGITASSLTDEMCFVLNDYPRWLLEKAGAKVDEVDSNFNLNTQVGQIEDMINMKKEILIIHPTDNFALADATLKARAKGIRILTTNLPIMDRNQTPIVDFYCGSPNVSMGVEIAKFFVEKANGKKVKIVEIMGLAGQIHSFDRDRGFRSIIDQHPNIEIVDSKYADWMTDKAYATMSDMLMATPDIWGVFSFCDNYVPAICSALEQAGRLYPVGNEKHILICAIDGASVSLSKIREGFVDMTIEHNPYTMAVAVSKASLMLAQGLDLPKYPDNFIDVPLTRITAENVDDPSLWGNFGVPHDVLWPRTQEIFESFKWLGDEKLYK